MINIRLAIIGTNFISDKLVDAIKQTEGIEAVAVYSRTKEKGSQFANKHAIGKVYCSFDDMLFDPDIDCVYVASPTFLHKEHTVKSLNAGKHVLCEKSISVNFDEFLEMKNAALKSGRVLLEAMRPAHDPSLNAIIESIGKIGKVRRAHFEFCKYSTRYDKFKLGIVENAFDPEMKNSALSDIGVYPLWLSVRLFGEPYSLFAASVKLSNGFDGAGSVILNYGEHITTIEYSKITEGCSASFIEGENGTLFIDKISEPRMLTLVLRNNEKKTVYSNPCENNMIFELESFRDMILGKKTYSDHLAISEALIRTMDKIKKCI